jgi:predicted Zn-dependent protease
MQRYNFQFTGQRFYRIEGGRLAGQLRDVAYQATTTDFWGSMRVVGGPQTYVLGGAFNCGKAQPGQVARSATAARWRCSRASTSSTPSRRRVDEQLVASAGRRREGAGRLQRRRAGRLRGGELEANLRWANNSLTTNGAMRSRQVVVVSFVDGGAGMAAGTVARTGNPDVEELVAASEQAAHDAGPAEDAVPLIASGPAGERRQVPATGTPTRGDLDRGVRRVRAGAGGGLRRRPRPRRPAVRLRRALHDHDLPRHLDGPAAAARPAHRPGRAQRQEHHYSRSVWAGVGTRDFRDVSVADLAADVERRLGWAQRRVEPAAGRYETVLPPSAVSDLMLYAYWTMEARDADEGRNVYAARAAATASATGWPSLPLTLRSDPHEPGLEACPFQVVSGSSGSASVFDNGMATPAVDWISGGVLTNLIRPRAWALKTTAPATAAVDNLVLEQPGATASLDEMVAATDRGLLLTTLWYIREVDPQTLLLTGLTRDGVFLVEGGEVTGAVNNFRFNESPVDLLGRITEVGRTERTLPREWSDWFTRAAMPAVRVPGLQHEQRQPGQLSRVARRAPGSSFTHPTAPLPQQSHPHRRFHQVSAVPPTAPRKP